MKQEIIRKCLEEFKAKGIRKMTVKEIVAPLGISTKTVYKYFENKEDLLEACLTLHYGQLQDDLLKVLKEKKSPVYKIFKIWIGAAQQDFGTTHLFYEDLNYYYPELQDKILKHNEKKFGEPITKVVQEGFSKGYFRKELNPNLVMEACSSIYAMLTRTPTFKKYKLHPYQIAENTVGVFLRGICTTKGLRELETYGSELKFN
ncbi:MAG: hypothetical protein C5B52_13850 [Bacteroidetes bacterium]|nr:MAG: hypothetical protein C5B52_13850 [Bacteroidota bacterium]